MKNLKIDRTKLITQAEYARLKGVSRAYVNAQVKRGNLETIEIKGAILIYQ